MVRQVLGLFYICYVQSNGIEVVYQPCIGDGKDFGLYKAFRIGVDAVWPRLYL